MQKITKTDLKKLIMEEVSKINKTKELESKKAQIERELKALNESEIGAVPTSVVSEAQFTAQTILDPNMPQPMAEGMDPGIMDALSTAITWLTSSSPSQVGNIPNAALLSGPALLALSTALAGVEKIKDKLMASKKAAPAPAPAAAPAPGASAPIR